MQIEENELNIQNLHCTCYLMQEALKKNISEFRDFLQLTVKDFFSKIFHVESFSRIRDISNNM